MSCLVPQFVHVDSALGRSAFGRLPRLGTQVIRYLGCIQVNPRRSAVKIRLVDRFVVISKSYLLMVIRGEIRPQTTPRGAKACRLLCGRPEWGLLGEKLEVR